MDNRWAGKFYYPYFDQNPNELRFEGHVCGLWTLVCRQWSSCFKLHKKLFQNISYKISNHCCQKSQKNGFGNPPQWRCLINGTF